MKKDLIPKYRDDKFRQIDNLFRIYREGNAELIQDQLPLLKEFQISQLYFIKYEDQIKSRPELYQQMSAIKNKVLYDNLYYINHFKQILKKLEENKLDVIVLKGMSLINHLYNDFSLRTFVDFDLLIQKKDVRKFVNIVSGLGYDPEYSGGSIETTQKFTAYNKKFKINIDILTRLNPNPFTERYLELKNNLIWSRAEKVSYDGIQSYRLSKEDELIYAIFHLGFHLYFEISLKWLFDIYFYLEKYEAELDEKYVKQELSRIGLSHVLYGESNLIYWAFGRNYSLLNLLAPTKLNCFQNNWMQYYVYPPRIFGKIKYRRNLFKRETDTLLKFALLDGSGKKTLFILDRLFPNRKRVETAYTQRFFLNEKLFYPIMRIIFIILSPLFFIFGFFYYLIASLIVRIKLMKYRFLK